MLQTSQIGNLHVYIALFVKQCKDGEQELSHFYHVSVDKQGKNIQQNRETAAPPYLEKPVGMGMNQLTKHGAMCRMEATSQEATGAIR